tara:strand:+ start:2900 stop:3481 length:582 start_codon:yes stop_codon:yes gene_type:complete
MIDPFALDEAPFGEPLSLVLGKSEQWRREINIDSGAHTLKYVLRHYEPSNVVIDYSITMTPVTSGEFAADVEPSDISGWAEGRYFWDLVVVRTSDDRSKVIETGEIRIFGTSADRRSHAEIMVAKIESILQNRADNDVESYTIKSRSITKMSAKELRDWRDYYIREIENRPANAGLFAVDGPKKDTLRVRFRD